MPFSVTLPTKAFPPRADTVKGTDWPLLMPEISFSGTAIFISTRSSFTSLKHPNPGAILLPVSTIRCEINPSKGARSSQFCSVLRAIRSAASASANFVCTSTKRISGKLPFLYSCSRRLKASRACDRVLIAMSCALCAEVLSITANSWPLRTA